MAGSREDELLALVKELFVSVYGEYEEDKHSPTRKSHPVDTGFEVLLARRKEPAAEEQDSGPT